ncbi:hypothetical protein D9M68_697190 [compost metagenome]
MLIIEFYIEIAHEMISLYTCLLGSTVLSEQLPGDHTFTDMHAAIIDHTGFNHIFTCCFQHIGYGYTQEVISQVTQMQRFIGVGRRVFYHNFFLRCSLRFQRIGQYIRLQEVCPVGICNAQVQKSGYSFVCGKQLMMLYQVSAYSIAQSHRILSECFYKRE